MKSISIRLARTVLLFDMAQFNPKGLNLWPLCEWLMKRYEFAAGPKNILDLSSDSSLAFKAGSFTNANGQNVLVSLAIYNNGVVAEAASSTDDAESLLDDVISNVSRDFGLTLPSDAGRAYVSHVEADFEFSLNVFSHKLASLATKLTDTVKTVDGRRHTFEFGALQFWTEDPNKPTAPAQFRFERKLDVPFSSNRYFSQAALRTKGHLEFLTELEAVFR